MNIKFTSFFRPMIYVLFGLTLIVACQKINPLDGVELVVNADIYTSPVLIRFVNAKSTATNQPTNFSIKVSGKDAGLVVMSEGGKDYKAANGLVTLALDTKTIPTPANPLSFTVSAEIPGFTPVTQQITVTGTDANEFQVQAVEYANPAEGTSATIQQSPLTGNTTPEISLVTPKTSTMTEASKVAIAAGTQLLDASGSVLTGTQLESRVAHYGTGTESSILSFPGGFSAPNVIGTDGKAIDGGVVFQTAGFMAIDMFVGGKEVKSFSKPVGVSMDLNNSLVNPTTGNAVKSGETIPVWSLNEETGQWQYESLATVTTGTDGKLKADFNVTHLSAWNVDWWVSTCYKPFTVTVRMPNPSARKVYWVEILDARGQYLSGLYSNTTWSAGVELYDGFTTTIPKVPNTSVKIVVFNGRGYDKVAETGFFNPCNTSSITVNVAPVIVPEKINVNFVMDAKCSNKSLTIKYTGYVSIYKQSENISKAINIYATSGTATAVLENNVPYVVVVPYDGKNYSTTFTPSKGTTTFPPEKSITATASYTSSTNTLKISGKITIDNCK
ncbi:hypothetical protein VB264_19805 [Arcicella aquatica]|uniref:Uncharacterized protein n=1 Tax=Arcicella aquatica TaxID=217141 RepID=A0ABU5QSG9_9BACT|nr:hypothetical protein [Arcicella aquatica]MEA5260053.1 hypothetical protein [Arcicella aquatica]